MTLSRTVIGFKSPPYDPIAAGSAAASGRAVPCLEFEGNGLHREGERYFNFFTLTSLKYTVSLAP